MPSSMDNLKKRKALIDAKADVWARAIEDRAKIKFAQDEIKNTIADIYREIGSRLTLRDKSNEKHQIESMKLQLEKLDKVLDLTKENLSECNTE